MFDRYQGEFKLEVSTQVAWTGELRLLLTNPPEAPARSIVFYSGDGGDPPYIVDRLLKDAEEWLATSGIER